MSNFPGRPALNDAVSDAMKACAEYAGVGDALGYAGSRGREQLLEAVTELWRWMSSEAKSATAAGEVQQKGGGDKRTGD